ncbi:hypothetical protein [Streptomyces sp. NPDC096012]|uniref:hypothetical protein n=1 Tax=Streptomyces sp. NPDC096012 TaxID=3155684 RepID=UPI00336AD940
MESRVLSAAFLVVALTAVTACESSGDGKHTASARPSSTAPRMRQNSVAGVVGTNPGTKAVGTPSTARVVGLGYEFRLLGTATTPVVSTDQGPRQAAAGQRLLLVRYDATGSLGGQSHSDTPGLTKRATLVVDGTRTVLSPDALPSGHDETVAMSVAQNAHDLSLEIETGDLVQSLSLVTGERSGADPVVLYRTDAENQDATGFPSVTAEISKRLSFPFALISSNGQQDTFPDGKYPTTIDVEKAHLTYTLTQPDSELRFPSSPDKAFLTLDTQVTGGNSWMTALPTKDFVLTTDKGQKVSAQRFDDPGLRTGDLQDSENAFFGGKVYWEVPGDTKSATLTITATKNHHMGGLFNSSMLDYHNKRQSFDIQF